METQDAATTTIPATSNISRKGSAFWLSFLAIVVSMFLSALDLSAVSTALPTITSDLNGGDNFVWIGSAYALSSTSILPLSGTLADIFGRKPIMLLSIVFFAVGSALAGSAKNIAMMIGARALQGVGGGALINLADILLSDLVPLADRGMYQGILAFVWSFASGIGPPIGGALTADASWRWLFYLNLPITGVAFGFVLLFLRVRTPEESIVHKLGQVDWLGNLIVIIGTTLAIIGLTWAGVRYPWNAVQVLAPLIIGLLLVGLFIVYEARVPRRPTIPLAVLSTRTTLSTFIAILIHGVVSISIIYFLPVYFQACLGADALRSGIDMLALSLVMAPAALLSGVIIQLMKMYRPTNALGWVLLVVGFGLLSMLQSDSSLSAWVGYQVLASTGAGIVWAGVIFPTLAPLSVSHAAAALAFLAFVRAFAQTWGITISSTILQNQLKTKLPSEFLAQFPEGVEIAYAAIPQISTLTEPLKTQVRAAFAESLSIIWKTMTGISGIGLLTMLSVQEIPMNQDMDENYGLKPTDKDGRGPP